MWGIKQSERMHWALAAIILAPMFANGAKRLLPGLSLVERSGLIGLSAFVLATGLTLAQIKIQGWVMRRRHTAEIVGAVYGVGAGLLALASQATRSI